MRLGPNRAFVVSVLSVSLALLLAHGFLFRTVAGILVAKEPQNGHFSRACLLDWCDVPDGDRCYDVAVELRRQGIVDGLLVVEPRKGRLVELGIQPTFASISRRELGQRGMTDPAVETSQSDGRDDCATARALRSRLLVHREETLLVLCAEFRSAHVRSAIDAVLGKELASQVEIRALPDRRFDQCNWWRSRMGIKTFGIEWIRLLHGWATGGDHVAARQCTAAEYESRYGRTLEGMLE